MYVSPNFKSKAEAKRALAAGTIVTAFAPGLGSPPHNGKCAVEGPHYPKPHTWYGEATIVNGVVTAIK